VRAGPLVCCGDSAQNLAIGHKNLAIRRKNRRISFES
jgi:hypothetical protein